MNIEDIYVLYKKSYLVSTDTRKVTKGCLFFALKGDNFNGNAFAEEALQKGASYAIIDEDEFKRDDRYIVVEDVLATLQQLANYHRKQLAIPIISLTGSNGKTTTKELINIVLSKKYQTTATLGNLNNHIGVPLTLLSMTTDTELGIVEMGANHQKEIEFLCDIAEPDYGCITNFGKAHLEGFGGVEGVIKGKSELYDYLKIRNKVAFVNANDSIQLERSEGIERISFGDTTSDIAIKLMSADPFVTMAYNDLIISSQLIGNYNFNNIAIAIAIGNYFKVGDSLIQEAIESYIPTNNRSQIIKKAGNKIILDAYNANPSSMQVAIENFSGLSDSHKVAILGDMFELGDVAAKEHQYIADFVADTTIDVIYLLGENFYRIKPKNPKVHLYKTFNDFKSFFVDQEINGASILIKASRGMALERILDLF